MQSLVIDAAGNVLGTTSSGDGTVFELANSGTPSAPVYSTPPAVVTNFPYDPITGIFYGPFSGLIKDTGGNLFGVTQQSPNGYGSVFEITNSGTALAPVYSATPTTLVNFTDPLKGSFPSGGLFLDGGGNLVGVTLQGGFWGEGNVFEVKKTNGVYESTPTPLVTFAPTSTGESFVQPWASLASDAAGNLFGTTYGGSGFGQVFEIFNEGSKTAPSYGGTEILANFFTLDHNTYGGGVKTTLVVDAAGNLFGTTATNGAYGFGTVFEISKTDGAYSSTPTVLMSFTGHHGGLVIDAAGDLYGTTDKGPDFGSALRDFGYAFEIVNSGTPLAPVYSSTPTTLAYFDSNSSTIDGTGLTPSAGLIRDSAGNIFGTAGQGGEFGRGIVFEISPGSALTNSAPVASADAIDAVEAGGALNGGPGTDPTINVLANDSDAGGTLSVVSVTPLAGAHGSLTVGPDGSALYTVHQTDVAVEALRTASDTLTDAYTYTIQDSAGATASATITVTIHGADDAPVAVADVGTAGENQTVSFNVLANDTDVDAGDTKSLSVLGTPVVTSSNSAVNGIAAAGAFSIVSGQMKFTPGTLFDKLAAGESATVVIPYSITDTAGLTSTANLTLSVIGASDKPVITTVAPDTGTSATDHVTSADVVSLSGTSDSGAAITIYDGASAVGITTADAGGAWTTSNVTLTEGTHSLTAKLIVGGQETSFVSSSVTVRIDKTGPAVAVTSQTLTADTGAASDDLVTNNGRVTLVGNVSDAVAVASVAVKDGATTLGNATINAAAGTWSYTTTLAAGQHTLSAEAKDTAGNLGSTAAEPVIIVDRTAPTLTVSQTLDQDTGPSVTDRVTSNGGVTVSGTITDATATSIDIFDRTAGTKLGTVAAGAGGAWTFHTVLGDAAHQFYAVATDLAGNVRTSANLPIITVQSAQPSLAITGQNLGTDTGSSPSDGITTNGLVTLTGSYIDPLTPTISIKDGAITLGKAIINASAGTWSFTSTLAAGSHALSANLTDSTGNTAATAAASPIIVDRTAPTLTIGQVLVSDTGVATDRITSDGHITFSGTAADTVGLAPGASITLFDAATSVSLGTATAAPNGTWTSSLILGDGTRQIYAVVADLAGNTKTTAALPAIVVDTSPPTITIGSQTLAVDTGASSSDGVSSNGAVTLTGTVGDNRAGATVSIYDGTIKLGAATINAAAGTWSYSKTLGAGDHHLSALVSDAAGNTATANATQSITIDKAAPVPAFSDIIQPATGQFTLLGSTEKNASVSLFDGSSTLAFATVTADANGNWLIPNVTATTAHSLTVKSTDQAGNTGTSLGKLFIGTTGNESFTGGSGNDLLFGNGGTDLLKGAAGSDTFDFAPNFGKQTVADFTHATDLLEFSVNQFADFAAVMAHATEVHPTVTTADVIIAQDALNTVTLKNIHLRHSRRATSSSIPEQGGDRVLAGPTGRVPWQLSDRLIGVMGSGRSLQKARNPDEARAAYAEVAPQNRDLAVSVLPGETPGRQLSALSRPGRDPAFDRGLRGGRTGHDGPGPIHHPVDRGRDRSAEGPAGATGDAAVKLPANPALWLALIVGVVGLFFLIVSVAPLPLPPAIGAPR